MGEVQKVLKTDVLCVKMIPYKGEGELVLKESLDTTLPLRYIKCQISKYENGF